MIVWYGRFPGETEPSTAKQAPRFCSAIPVPGTTIPLPKPWKLDWIIEIIKPSPSAAQR
jgi:hypothetical protein